MMPVCRARRLGLLFAALLVCAVPTRLSAVRRVSLSLDATTGLPIAPIHSLAQDARGYIWIGTQGGLVRYDGHDLRRWAPDLLHVDISWLAASRQGALVGVTGTHELFEVTGDSVRFVSDDGGHAVGEVTRIAFDGRGTLWLAAGGRLRWRTAAGMWGTVPSALVAGEPVRSVAASDASIYAASLQHVWVIDGPGVVAGAITHESRPIDVAGVGGMLAVDGDLWLGTPTGTVIVGREGPRRLAGFDGRPGPFVERFGAVWASSEGALLAYRDRRLAEALGPREGLTSAGALVVDLEGGLWLGNFTGVTYFPEPDTVTWDDADGLPSAHARRVYIAADGIWFLTWHGVGRLVQADGAWQVRTEPAMGGDALCASANGDVWASPRAAGRLAHHQRDRFVEVRVGADDERVEACAPSPTGVWAVTARGVYHVNAATHRVARLPPPAPLANRGGSIGAIYGDRDTVWLTIDEDVCRAVVPNPDADIAASWRCERLRGVGVITSVLRLADGSVWATTRFDGLWRFDGERWTPIEASRHLSSRWFNGVRPGRDGSVWVLGGGEALRVRDTGAQGTGWEIVERIGPGQGYQGNSANDLVEAADGSVWIASFAGVTRVAPTARHPEPAPPALSVAEIRVNGARVPSDRLPQVRAGDALDVSIAVPSFRDRRQLRIEGRVSADTDWFELPERDPTIRLARVPPGRYTMSARASRDGRTWTTLSSPVTFLVPRPWYQRWWALAGALAVLVAAAWTLHRIRLGVAIRLHEQRVRLARDLHDDLGSGLGSIGILAGVAGGEEVSDVERRRLASTIADSAADLGAALSDIVWSLRPGPATLEALMYYLLDRATRLVPGPEPSLTTELPAEWPRAELSLVLRRNLLLIALEALRNAVRHANARSIVLGLRPVPGPAWVLEVSDDGCGLGAGGVVFAAGHGLDNMRRRAEEVGGTISVTAAARGGTTVVLTFEMASCDPVSARRLSRAVQGSGQAAPGGASRRLS